MELLLSLLLAHFLGDFVLQSSKWVKEKELKGIRSKYFWLHIAIHLILMLLLTGFELGLIPIVIGITISHYIIDLSKIKLQN